MKVTKAQKIQAKITKLYADLRCEQEACTHPNATRKGGSNTGGYDGPAFDYYWWDYTCPDCLKRWSVDQ